MTRDEAMQAIRASVALGSVTPLFELDRDAEIERLTADLVASAIEPAAATILGVAQNDSGLKQLVAQDPPLVIARSGDNWLGYLPGVKEFFLAYGPHPGRLNALGFHSSDALAEWRG
ncbi:MULTISPECIES: hypothetical protein [unclassified Rubrivivax]|uniref:hypothetical protein n=1 Tax=unclassified Rubrivivax TaxID=2649762 RepID=UPI0013E97420|nr:MULTISPECIES: hypothetical protein [unclassified Rubrivivax]MCC9598437.1 hypothetical protein [Rubrivivax sp. JA1055]MCC9648137.1 hypothetical protein [Rubrivivax sp. JA1029]